MSTCHEYPLRPGFKAQLVLPDDMTSAEARRLCAMLMTLVVPETGKDEEPKVD